MMRMPWFPPLGLLVGALCTRAGLQRRARARGDRHYRDWWLFLLIGWIPIAAWILSQWMEQY